MQEKKRIYRRFLNDLENTLLQFWKEDVDNELWIWFNKFSDYLDDLKKILEQI